MTTTHCAKFASRKHRHSHGGTVYVFFFTVQRRLLAEYHAMPEATSNIPLAAAAQWEILQTLFFLALHAIITIFEACCQAYHFCKVCSCFFLFALKISNTDKSFTQTTFFPPKRSSSTDDPCNFQEFYDALDLFWSAVTLVNRDGMHSATFNHF